MEHKEAKKKHEEFEARGWNALYKRALNTVQAGDEAAKSIGVLSLLVTWNRAWYSRSGQAAWWNVDKHILEIEEAVKAVNKAASNISLRNLLETDLDNPEIQSFVRIAFSRFNSICGATGASKALHLLYPEFFVMWDAKIAKTFSAPPDEKGYLAFLKKSKEQLGEMIKSFAKEENISFKEAQEKLEQSFEVSLPKVLDEFNWLTIVREML